MPLGWRVLNRINGIIRQEMNAIGAQEVLLPSLIAKKYWEQSGRWDVDVMYKLSGELPEAGSREQKISEDYGLGWTHEEVVAAIGERFINFEKDLPAAVYQIQTKFRREPRARGGLIRTREFLMKDLYSFHATAADLNRYYQTVMGAYQKILDGCNLSYKIVEAGGGAFTQEHTHEFQVLTPAGEDVILYCDRCTFAQNQEIAQVHAGDQCPACGNAISEARGIETANVFKLGQRFSRWFMGSYGLGPSRLMGTIVEMFHDEHGIIWPDSIAPFSVHLLALPGAVNADRLYQQLQHDGIEVLYDDRDLSPGEKFADADLIGIPHRLVVSQKTGELLELKRRGLAETRLVSYEQLLQLLS